MAKRRTVRGGLPRDEVQVRAFLLADHAVQEQTGKVYVNGGFVEWIGVPDPVERMPALWLVIRLGFPWRLSSQTHTVTIRVLDQDEKPVGPDPLASATADVGRAPGTAPGDDFGVNIVLPLGNYPIKARPDMNLFFHLIVNDQEIAVLPLKLKRIATLLGVPG